MSEHCTYNDEGVATSCSRTPQTESETPAPEPTTVYVQPTEVPTGPFDDVEHSTPGGSVEQAGVSSPVPLETASEGSVQEAVSEVPAAVPAATLPETGPAGAAFLLLAGVMLGVLGVIVRRALH